jgi:sarcosine oxidase, subunit alpha
MAKRLRIFAPKSPVTFSVDGDGVVAEAGEPLAVALVGAGYWNVSRSPKFHRPRGPACFRGACEGCLVRVDDRPNVMSCMVPVREGMKVETQNTWGVRELDLLGATDFFFPKGLDHHEFMAGVPGVQQAMEAFARRVVGMGTLPGSSEPLESAEPEQATVVCDVLVIGAGPSGLAVARELAKRGLSCLVVDEAFQAGGSLSHAVLTDAGATWSAWFSKTGFGETGFSLRGSKHQDLRLQASAIGFFRDGGGERPMVCLVATKTQMFQVKPRACVFATGAHEVLPVFSGNDLPAVLGVEAAARMACYGVKPGHAPVIVTQSKSAALEAFAETIGASIVLGVPVGASGRGQVNGIRVRQGESEARHSADAVLVQTGRSGCYELAVQAGAAVHWHEPASVDKGSGGFAIQTDERGRAGDHIWAIGSNTGAEFGTPTDLEEHAVTLAADVASVLA